MRSPLNKKDGNGHLEIAAKNAAYENVLHVIYKRLLQTSKLLIYKRQKALMIHHF